MMITAVHAQSHKNTNKPCIFGSFMRFILFILDCDSDISEVGDQSKHHNFNVISHAGVWIDSDAESSCEDVCDPVCGSPTLSAVSVDPPILQNIPILKSDKTLISNENRRYAAHLRKIDRLGSRITKINFMDNVRSVVEQHARESFLKKETVEDLVDNFVSDYQAVPRSTRGRNSIDNTQNSLKRSASTRPFIRSYYRGNNQNFNIEEAAEMEADMLSTVHSVMKEGQGAAKGFLGLLHLRLTDNFGVNKINTKSENNVTENKPTGLGFLGRWGRRVTEESSRFASRSWNRFISEPPKYNR